MTRTLGDIEGRCPKCGDQACSRTRKWGFYQVHADGGIQDVEALEIRCLACGAPLGLYWPLDHEKAGMEVES